MGSVPTGILIFIAWFLIVAFILYVISASANNNKVSYECVNGRCLTVCEHFKNKMVGSYGCSICDYYRANNDLDEYVLCAFPEVVSENGGE